jgi:hypothetical protein
VAENHRKFTKKAIRMYGLLKDGKRLLTFIAGKIILTRYFKKNPHHKPLAKKIKKGKSRPEK